MIAKAFFILSPFQQGSSFDPGLTYRGLGVFFFLSFVDFPNSSVHPWLLLCIPWVPSFCPSPLWCAPGSRVFKELSVKLFWPVGQVYTLGWPFHLGLLQGWVRRHQFPCCQSLGYRDSGTGDFST